MKKILRVTLVIFGALALLILGLQALGFIPNQKFKPFADDLFNNEF